MGRPAKPDGERVRDIAPTGIRLPPELREALVREAEINRRTISGEVIHRLRQSFDVRHVTTTMSTGEAAAGYAMTTRQADPLSDAQRVLLRLFDAMSPEKQLALLTVLKR